jgi:hypothetical protein
VGLIVGLNVVVGTYLLPHEHQSAHVRCYVTACWLMLMWEVSSHKVIYQNSAFHRAIAVTCLISPSSLLTYNSTAYPIQTKELRGLSQRANYTGRASAACGRS